MEREYEKGATLARWHSGTTFALRAIIHRKQKTMKTLTDQDRAEGLTILADIRRRPAYHLACVWLERFALTHDAPIGWPDEWQNGWVSVGWVINVLQRTFGGHVHEETMLAALADRGFTVRDSRRGAETNLSELVLIDRIKAGTKPRPLADLSDPTPTAMGMH